MQDYEKEYEDFWKDIVEKDGEINLDQVKKELYDFSWMNTEVPKVYDHVTTGRISKPNTKAFEVISVHDEIRSNKIDEAFKEGREYQRDIAENEPIKKGCNE